MAPLLAESSTTFLSTTLLVSFAVIGYSLYSMKKKVEELTSTKQDINEDDILDENMYQSWAGTYGDSEESLIITVLRQKVCSKKANRAWLDWDGSSDASVISRNFYLGNSDPCFVWTVTQRETDTKATVKETMTDGWNSLIQVKLAAFVKELSTSDQFNAFVKKLIEEDKIVWKKSLLSKGEFKYLFN